MEEQENKIKVYIKVNEEKYITEINSDCFITNTKGYILIDEGIGDKYALAQNNYLDEPITSNSGKYNYKFIDNKIVGDK